MVDRATFQAELDRLRVREKVHTREGDAVAEQIQRGNTLPLSGTFSGAKVAYLPTDRDLGVIVEIFSGTPGAEQEPDAT